MGCCVTQHHCMLILTIDCCLAAKYAIHGWSISSGTYFINSVNDPNSKLMGIFRQ
jgi:hypothetical protein